MEISYALLIGAVLPLGGLFPGQLEKFLSSKWIPAWLIRLVGSPGISWWSSYAKTCETLISA
jgi:hypothetical protein